PHRASSPSYVWRPPSAYKPVILSLSFEPSDASNSLITSSDLIPYLSPLELMGATLGPRRQDLVDLLLLPNRVEARWSRQLHNEAVGCNRQTAADQRSLSRDFVLESTVRPVSAATSDGLLARR
ncbi:MAG: hypothetical protein WAL25_10050, partial [Acidimicrobiia bacterium]